MISRTWDLGRLRAEGASASLAEALAEAGFGIWYVGFRL